MVATLTDDDEGKTVKNAEGADIGIVEDVRGGTAYVNPDPGITDQIKSKLGWGDADEETYALDADRIERVDDDTVWLQSNL